jgi:hypothetical protein
VAQIQERLEFVTGEATPKKGGRAALWTRLLWEMLLLDLAGKGVELITDDSAGSA